MSLHCRRVGEDGKHLKLKLAERTWRKQMDAIGFGLGDWAKRMPQKIDAAYHAEINEWNGKTQLANAIAGYPSG